jgi:hypothetical protein
MHCIRNTPTQRKKQRPLKEVLTQQSERAPRAAIEPIAMLAISDAKNAGKIDTAICQACRKRLCRSCFRNSCSKRLLRERMQRESSAPPKSRMRGLRVADFGNEKIFMLNGLFGRRRQPNPIFRTNRDNPIRSARGFSFDAPRAISDRH